MATFSTTGTRLGPPTLVVPENYYADSADGYLHKNDSLRSTHYSGGQQIPNYVYSPNFLLSVTASHKTLLSTLYSGQDKYILDVWYEVGPNGEHIIKTLSNANDAQHFVFIKDPDGKTYTSIQTAQSNYIVETESPLVPQEVYAATPSRVMFITDSDNFNESFVFSGTYTFGSVCDTTDLQNQLDACLQEKANLQTQLTQCQNDLAQAQADLAACQSDLTNCQNNLTNCQSDLSICNTNLSTCNNNLSTCNNNLTTCQNDLSSCQTQNTQLQSDLDTCNNSLTNCQNTVTSQQAIIDSLNQQVTDLQNQVITLQTQLTAAQDEIATLQAALADCQATSAPYVPVTNYSVVEKDGGILVQVETERMSDLYLFVKQKSTGEIVKSVRSLTSTTAHTIFIPIPRGDYVIDYLAIKPA